MTKKLIKNMIRNHIDLTNMYRVVQNKREFLKKFFELRILLDIAEIEDIDFCENNDEWDTFDELYNKFEEYYFTEIEIL